MNITVTVDSKKVQDYIDRLTVQVPKEADSMGREIAMDIRRGARMREKVKRLGKSTKGLLWRGMDIARLTRGKMIQWIFLSLAPYTRVQEMGIRGWHFVPSPGLGRWGEGYARPGGAIPSAYPQGKRFIEGAYNATNKKLPIITKRYADRMVRG